MDYTLALYNQAAHRGAVDARDAAQAGDREGLPGGDPGPRATTRCWRCAGWSSTASTATSSSPIATVFRAAPATGCRRSIGRRSASCTSASACVCRTSATPGSTRCSRCPRRCCTPAWSTTSIANDTPAKPDYTTLWEHIRECIDLAHRDGSIKAIVSVELTDYVERDEGLADTLHKFRSSGKRLFLLTNSAWDYTVDGDELPARRRARRLPVVAELLRRRRRQRRQAGVLHRGAPVRRAGRRRQSRSRRRRTDRSSAGASIRAATSRRSRRGRTPTAIACCSSATTSTATCCAVAEVVQLADGDGAAGAGARDHDVRPSAARAVAPGPPGRAS